MRSKIRNRSLAAAFTHERLMWEAMMRSARRSAAMIGLCTLAAAPAWADQKPDAKTEADRLVTSQELAEMAAHPGEGRTSKDIWVGTNYLVMTSLRPSAGRPEVHDQMADLFIVQEGGADVLLDGALSGESVISPGERRGGVIEGGHVRHLAVGDILWIPAGMPHQVTPIGPKPFRYLVVKVAKTEKTSS